MTNFDEFKKAAAETAGTVADKSIVFARKVADKTKCVARIAVLRAEIAGEKDLLRNDFKELGKAYYNHHKDDPEPALAQLCTDVSVAAERIAAKRKEIEQLKEQLKEQAKDDVPQAAAPAEDADSVPFNENEPVDVPDADEPAGEAKAEQEPCCCGCAETESAAATVEEVTRVECGCADAPEEPEKKDE